MSKSNILTMVITLLGCLILFNWYNQNMQVKLSTYERNLMASRDTIECVRLENGELLSHQMTYVTTLSDLKRENRDLYNTIREQEKILDSNAERIAYFESQLKADTLQTKGDSIIYIDNTPAMVQWNYKDNYISLRGESKIKDMVTTLYDIYINTSSRITWMKSGDVAITYDNPYIQTQTISGAEIRKRYETKPRRFSLGVAIGPTITNDGFYPWGLTLGINYRIW